MNLNHINLVVTDVTAARQLFETYFHFTCTAIKGNDAIAILKGADAFSLVLMADKNGPALYPKAFHIGFMLPSDETVTTLYNRLQQARIPVPQAPGKIRDSFGFYFTHDTIMIEVACMASGS